MAIKVIVELQAKPGMRDELKGLLDGMVAEHGPGQEGFLGVRVMRIWRTPTC